MTDTDHLIQRVAELERRLAIVEDKEAIERLQYIYGYYLDNHMWNEMIELFADGKSSVEIGRRGIYRGKDGVRSFFLNVLGKDGWGLKKNEFANHIQLQLVITVDADRRCAKGRSRALIQASTLPDNATIRWVEGVYENTYIKENGVWKFEDLRWAPTFYAFMPVAGSIWFESQPEDERFPPNVPSHPKDEALGRSFPPFHYAHPITGRWVPSPSGHTSDDCK